MALNERFTEFEILARNYCGCIEDCPKRGKEFLQAVRAVLLPLYAAAVDLPEPEEVLFGDIEGDKEEEAQRFQRLSHRLQGLGFQDTYRMFFYPMREDPEDSPMLHTLSDDLADIWRDLKPELDALDIVSAEQVPDIYWHWKFSFETHWGRHAIQALYAIHAHLEDS